MESKKMKKDVMMAATVATETSVIQIVTVIEQETDYVYHVVEMDVVVHVNLNNRLPTQYVVVTTITKKYIVQEQLEQD